MRNFQSVIRWSLAMVMLLVMQSAVMSQESAETKVARLLNESGKKLAKIAAETWTVPYEGRSIKDITVVVSVGDGVVVAFALVPESKNAKFPPQTLHKLLGFNESLDRVKIGIDKDGLVFVRIDMTARTVDKDELSAALDQVAAAVDEIFPEIRPHLPKAK